jgi:hypothetical protein
LVGESDLVGGSLPLSDTGISGTAILGARHKHLASRLLVLVLLLHQAPFVFILVRARGFFFGYGEEELLFSFFLSLSSGNIIVKSRRFTYVIWECACIIPEFFPAALNHGNFLV